MKLETFEEKLRRCEDLISDINVLYRRLTYDFAFLDFKVVKWILKDTKY